MPTNRAGEACLIAIGVGVVDGTQMARSVLVAADLTRRFGAHIARPAVIASFGRVVTTNVVTRSPSVSTRDSPRRRVCILEVSRDVKAPRAVVTVISTIDSVTTTRRIHHGYLVVAS